jgi:hypothetical protein
MRSAIIAAIVAALVSSAVTFAAADATRLFAGGADLVSNDSSRTTLGVRGPQSSNSTAKVSHMPSAPGATDPNAAALSLWVEGDGTTTPATQGLFFDAPAGTTGKLENWRIAGREVLTVKPDPAYPPSDPHVIVTVRGKVVQAP